MLLQETAVYAIINHEGHERIKREHSFVCEFIGL